MSRRRPNPIAPAIGLMQAAEDLTRRCKHRFRVRRQLVTICLTCGGERSGIDNTWIPPFRTPSCRRVQ